MDVPEVVNLVFMKPVQSRIKLWQMIGRGTRNNEACRHHDLLPNGHKDDFLIIDFWENDFERTADPDVPQALPVLVSIFNTRLRQMELYLSNQAAPEAQVVIAHLRRQLNQLPLETFSVKKMLPEINQAFDDHFWLHLTTSKIDFLRNKVGPLLRFAPGVDAQATTFESKVERLKLQILTGKDPTASAESIAADVGRLPTYVFNEPANQALATLCLSPALRTALPSDLDAVIENLAPQMKNRREQVNSFLTLDLPDYIELRGYIYLKGGTQQVYIKDYRDQVEKRILDMVESDPVIAAIDLGRPVSDLQLISLERSLRRNLGSGSVELSEGNIRKAFGFKVGSLIEFLRVLLDLKNIPDYAEIIRRQFEAFISGHPFNADQIRFLRAVQTVIVQSKTLHQADLYDPPFDAFGYNAVERLFTPVQLGEILQFTATLQVVA